MRAIPPAARAKLPKEWQNFKTNVRPWLVQLAYGDPLLHYEVVTLGERRGVLEIGLHFESRNPAVNARLLDGFMRHLFEIKAELGDEIEAEMWDKGWTKVYETIPLEAFDEAYLDRVAERLAHVIVVLQPILEHLTAGK
jgi:hypothetical protein